MVKCLPDPIAPNGSPAFPPVEPRAPWEPASSHVHGRGLLMHSSCSQQLEQKPGKILLGVLLHIFIFFIFLLFYYFVFLEISSICCLKSKSRCFTKKGPHQGPSFKLLLYWKALVFRVMGVSCTHLSFLIPVQGPLDFSAFRAPRGMGC